MLPASLLALLYSALGASAAFTPRARGTPAALRRRDIWTFGLNSTADAPAGAALVPIGLSSDGQSYYVVATAGGIQFRLALDTGSADTWLVSSACAGGGCKGVPNYPLGYHSPTFGVVNANETAFNVSFADTTQATGFVAAETFALSNVSVSEQGFGVVTSTNVTFPDQISGVLGLSFPRLSTITHSLATATPFFASLAQRGLVSYPLFGLNLGLDQSGSLALGAVDATVLTNSSLIEWNSVYEFPPFGTERNVSGYLHWAVALDSISVNGTTALTPIPSYPNITNNASLAIFDVGTPGIFGPYADVARIYAAIPGSRIIDTDVGQWAVPCTTSMTLSFTFGNTNFTMQPTDYFIGPASGNPNMCLTWPAARLQTGDGLDWQIGTAFLRTVYSIFSYGIDNEEPPMVGLFPLRNASAPVEPPTSVSSFLAAAGATVATTLPNFFMPTPTPSRVPYALNASVPARAGAVVSSDLAVSTYRPLLRSAASAVSRASMPVVAPAPSVVTIVSTNAGGVTFTSTSHLPVPSIALGRIPGATSAGARVLPAGLLSVSFFAALFVPYLMSRTF